MSRRRPGGAETRNGHSSDAKAASLAQAGGTGHTRHQASLKACACGTFDPMNSMNDNLNDMGLTCFNEHRRCFQSMMGALESIESCPVQFVCYHSCDML